jgi:hypothetical protein
MPRSNQPTITVMQADRVAAILSEREGTQFKFFRFLNLARFSLVFESADKQQRVLTVDNVKNLLNKGEMQ